MDRQTKTPKSVKRVTKSIRLTPDEASELAQLVEGTAYAEAALLRQWVLMGMQQFRVAEAIRRYQDGQVDIWQAAEHARLPVAVFLEELAARKVAVLESLNAFGPGLDALRETFGPEASGSPEAVSPEGNTRDSV